VSPATGSNVKIINDAAPLALAFPGHLYVSTGLLDILENETELAAVLALKAASARQKDSYANFRMAYGKKRFTEFMSVILAAGFIVGGAVAGAAAASSATTYQSAMQSAAVWGQAGGVMAGIPLSYALTTSVGKLPERKALLNRKGPPASWQGTGAGIDHNAVMITAQAFLHEIYGGYEVETELRNIDDAVSSMKRAGYDPAGIAVVYWKLLQLRDRYLAKGYVSALFTAKPGLEKKIEHAESVLKQNR
jgi:predicted Zn-dependent protease